MAQSAVAGAAKPARRWLEYLARWGFIANATVYLVVGGLVVELAIGNGGRITDPSGAFLAIRRSSGGNAFLFALSVGFFSYALWRLLAAIFDSDGDGRSASGIASRVFGVVKGLAYAALGMDALRFAVDARAGGDGWQRALAAGPGGAILMLAIALGVLAFAGFEMYRAYESKLSQGLRLGNLGAAARTGIMAISRFGIGARAVVIAAFGLLMMRAILAGHPARTPAATDSIRTVAQSEPLLYLAIGLGLMAYGVYLVILSRYRIVRTA